MTDRIEDVQVGDIIRVWEHGKLLATVPAADLVLPLPIPSIPAQKTPGLVLDIHCGICHESVSSDLFPDHAKAHGEEDVEDSAKHEAGTPIFEGECSHIGEAGNDECSHCGMQL